MFKKTLTTLAVALTALVAVPAAALAEVPLLASWTTGGALALAAAFLGVMTTVRRQRLSQD